MNGKRTIVFIIDSSKARLIRVLVRPSGHHLRYEVSYVGPRHFTLDGALCRVWGLEVCVHNYALGVFLKQECRVVKSRWCIDGIGAGKRLARCLKVPRGSPRFFSHLFSYNECRGLSRS